MSFLRRFIRDEAGATAIEYGLIAAGISIAIIAVVQGVGTKLFDLHAGRAGAQVIGRLFALAEGFGHRPGPSGVRGLGIRRCSLIAQGLGVALDAGVCCVRRSRPPPP